MSKRPRAIKQKWDSRAARVQQERRRKSKLGISWATRKRGTPKQIGQKFPVKAGSKFGMEGAGRWLEKSAKIVGMGTARAERYLEKGAEKLGHIAATPKRLKQAYKRGYENPYGPVKQQVQTTLAPAKPGVEPKYAGIGDGRFVSGDLLKRLDNFILKTRRRLNSYGLTSSQRAALTEKLSKAEELRTEVEGISEAMKVSSGLDAARLKTREEQIKREVFAIGGKYWLKQALKKRMKGVLRKTVSRRFGRAGFDSKNRIKMSVLEELAKESNPTGARARLAIKLRSFHKAGGKDRVSDRPIKAQRSRREIEDRQKTYGSMILRPHSFTSDASDAIRIPGFVAKSHWSEKARRK